MLTQKQATTLKSLIPPVVLHCRPTTRDFDAFRVTRVGQNEWDVINHYVQQFIPEFDLHSLKYNSLEVSSPHGAQQSLHGFSEGKSEPVGFLQTKT